jgi:hypothetical protein
MLRRPSFCQRILREEGCSSTACDGRGGAAVAFWDKPAERTSATAAPPRPSAVP